MQVNYINAHATSTLVGDVAELNAVKSVFTDVKNIKINGTKSMIGHGLGAAGGLEGVATVKAITTGWLHPTLNQASIHILHFEFQTPSPPKLVGRTCFIGWLLVSKGSGINVGSLTLGQHH